MQMQLLQKKHEKFILEKLNMTVDKFKSMSYDELDKLVDDKLMWIECDGVNDELPDGIAEDGKLAAELIDIIYGPYDGSNFDEESVEEKKAVAV